MAPLASPHTKVVSTSRYAPALATRLPVLPANLHRHPRVVRVAPAVAGGDVGRVQAALSPDTEKTALRLNFLEKQLLSAL